MNSNVLRCQEVTQGVDNDMSQRSIFIEYDCKNMGHLIKEQETTDMKDVSNHAQHSIPVQFGRWLAQPLACPDDHIVSQAAQQNQNLLCFKALFVPLGQTQSLLVSLQGRFNTPTSLIVKVDIGQQDCRRGREGRL